MATEPNHRLVAVIDRAGFSNSQLGKEVRQLSQERGWGPTVSASHIDVGRWTRGEHQPRGKTPFLIAEVLSRELGERITPQDIGMGYAEESRDQFVFPSIATDGVGAVQGMVGADLADNPLFARSGISLPSWNESVVGWLLGRSPLSEVPADSSRISRANVDQVEMMTAALNTLDYKFGGGHARTAVLEYIARDVAPLLKEASPTSQVGRDFLSASAVLLRLAGWMAYDSGRHGPAQRYFRAGLDLAIAADSKMLGGRVLSNMSHQANYLGHFREAADLAIAAQRGAAQASTPTGIALFHAMEARALASQGDEAGCTQALSAAERAFSRRDPTEDPTWLKYFDEAELAAEFAHCFRDLGHPAKAREYVLHSVSKSESLYVRSLSFVRTILATSEVQEGNLDQALVHAQDVVETATDLRSARTRRYVREFDDTIAPYSDDKRVAEFRRYAREKLGNARGRPPKHLG